MKTICDCPLCMEGTDTTVHLAHSLTATLAQYADKPKDEVMFEGMDDMAEYQRLELQIKKELGW